MSKLTRITITVPNELLDAADAKLNKGEASRSALIRRIIEDALREAVQREKVEQYVRGYCEDPPTDDEFGWQDELAVEALKELPWDAPR
jgi:Arc/MetJ-type ribon-helix-helix transcriptional regulator